MRCKLKPPSSEVAFFCAARLVALTAAGPFSQNSVRPFCRKGRTSESIGPPVSK